MNAYCGDKRDKPDTQQAAEFLGSNPRDISLPWYFNVSADMLRTWVFNWVRFWVDFRVTFYNMFVSKYVLNQHLRRRRREEWIERILRAPDLQAVYNMTHPNADAELNQQETRIRTAPNDGDRDDCQQLVPSAASESVTFICISEDLPPAYHDIDCPPPAYDCLDTPWA